MTPAFRWSVVCYSPTAGRIILTQYRTREQAWRARRLLIAHLGADPKQLRVEYGT